MKKKLLTITLATLFTLVLLAACGDGNDDTDVATHVSDTEQTQTATSPNIEEAIDIPFNEQNSEIDDNLSDETIVRAPQVRIVLSNSRITDEYLVEMVASGEIPANVTDLNLSFNRISDISPLVELTSLRRLSLGNNQINDASPLAGLTNLESLLLYRNEIDDISSLVGLTNLTRLQLGYNNISNISSLSGMANMRILRLSHNNISDISPLADMANLIELQLAANQIGDISPLVNMTELISLTLWDNPFNDWSPIDHLDIHVSGRP